MQDDEVPHLLELRLRLAVVLVDVGLAHTGAGEHLQQPRDAACVGNVFDIGTLSIICEFSQAVLRAQLALGYAVGVTEPGNMLNSLGTAEALPKGWSYDAAISGTALTTSCGVT